MPSCSAPSFVLTRLCDPVPQFLRVKWNCYVHLWKGCLLQVSRVKVRAYWPSTFPAGCVTCGQVTCPL